jgi:predicted Zn-dependent peptidase
VGEQLGDWAGDAAAPAIIAAPPREYHHEVSDTNQVHIGVAYDAPPPRDLKNAMLQRLAAAVLSGGMSGRLFHEVREVRGLCYSVYAAYMQMAHAGTVYAYAGTTTQRATQTLEVLTGELKRLGDGVTRDEFDRAVVGLKSRLVMQGESTAARAGAIANDQHLLGGPRTLDDIAKQIDAVTLEDLVAFVADHRPREFTILTIGPDPLVGATNVS